MKVKVGGGEEHAFSKCIGVETGCLPGTEHAREGFYCLRICTSMHVPRADIVDLVVKDGGEK